MNLISEARLNLALQVYTQDGTFAFGSHSCLEKGWTDHPFSIGCYRTTCRIPGNLLNSGVYILRILFVRNQSSVIYCADDILTFEVHEAIEQRQGWFGKYGGAVRPLLNWSTSPLNEG
jgi:lipopolysaccharide transport system ATP-binding protein